MLILYNFGGALLNPFVDRARLHLFGDFGFVSTSESDSDSVLLSSCWCILNLIIDIGFDGGEVDIFYGDQIN